MSVFKRIIDIFLRECHRLKANRVYLFSMIVFPVFVTLFFTSLMQEGQPQDMPVGVVDLDNSTTTRKLTRMLDSFQSSKVVGHYPNFESARLAMQHGEIYGFLYFPKGTTADLLASRQPTVSYYYSYASLTAGSLVFKDLKTVATLGTAGVGKSVMSAKGYTDRQIATFLQPIAIDLHTVGNPWVNYNIYLSTMLVPTCLLLFIFLVTAYSMGSELKMSTARELYARAGGNPFVAVTGKMLPQTVVWLAIMLGYMSYPLAVLHVCRARLSASGRMVLYRRPRRAERARCTRLRRVHVWPVSVDAHVDEHVLAVGSAELLDGGHGVPYARYGSCLAVDGTAFPHAPFLHHLRDCGVRCQSVD